MDSQNKITPMMRQFLDIKKDYQDAVLFFRMGDFYEMFQSDAVEVSGLLNLTLTKRGGSPMCGVPYHAAGNYIKRLLNLGKKIAVCEQVSGPEQGKGIVDRQVVRIITPGTVIEEDYLEENSNNYIAAAAVFSDFLSFSYIDISTGQFFTTSFSSIATDEKLKKELFRIQCKELLIQESLFSDHPKLAEFLKSNNDLIINRYPDWSFNTESSVAQLKSIFHTATLKGFGLKEDDPGLYTCGILLEYLKENSKSSLSHISTLKRYYEDDYLLMDEATLRNLEIVKNLQDGSKSFTLLKVLDYTKTSSGARLLKEWLLNPLRNVNEILNRQNRVAFFFHNQLLLSGVREQLGCILDIERLATRISMDKAHAKDLNALSQSLFAFLELRLLLMDSDPNQYFFNQTESFYEKISDLAFLIQNAILDEPSILLTDGRMIRQGYNKELDRVRELRDNSKQVLNEYLESEKKASGINNLKVKYNKIIGYFIEVTKSNLDQVPNHFIRRQSIVSAERFTTDQLADLEGKLNSSIGQAIELEKELFLKLRESLKSDLLLFYKVASITSKLDCFQSFAQAATVNNYHKPSIHFVPSLFIDQGRHPVVERSLKNEQFVPNSVALNNKDNSFILITGPNMAGKSTLLRQVALITLMAHAGSFVPASEAEIGLTDRIFCRVGASDNLARGESTFLVEMIETANILQNATDQSLVIMDEVGRGTATNDGLSIAWAVSEALLDRRARTLFATHYHELTLLKNNSLKNMSLKVLQKGGEIIFLKELGEGPAESSYGIYAAKLAGVPESVLSRAKEVMAHLISQEKKEMDTLPNPSLIEQNLFSPSDELFQIISSYDLYNKSPIEAMQDIAMWQKKIRELS